MSINKIWLTQTSSEVESIRLLCEFTDGWDKSQLESHTGANSEEPQGARGTLRDARAQARGTGGLQPLARKKSNEPRAAVAVCQHTTAHILVVFLVCVWETQADICKMNECYLPGCIPVGQSTGFQVSGLCRSGPKHADTRRSGRSELHKSEHVARCTHKHTWKKDSSSEASIIGWKTDQQDSEMHGWPKNTAHWPKPADSP